jgi:hypothetical protein
MSYSCEGKSVCLFFVHFHTVALTLTKFGKMVEDLPGEVLDTWKQNFFSVKVPKSQCEDVAHTFSYMIDID